MQDMEITVIHEHSVCLSMIPKKANIIDIGARGELFYNHFKALGHNVFGIDADNLRGISHPNLAISNFNGVATIIESNDPQATRIVKYKDNSGLPSTRLIECMTIASFSNVVNVDFWHVVKCDIEGSEYEMIMSWEKPWCHQLSVEFHQHLGQTDKQIKEMEDKLLSLGYFPVKHDKYPAHGLPPNYWDSLWILKR